MIQIQKISALTESQISNLREIFFLSAAPRDFQTEEEKESFFRKWTQPYFQNWPHQIWVAVEDQQIVGYLMGCDDSEKAIPILGRSLPIYLVFADLFPEFPAHLHVNVHPAYRSEGLGSALIATFTESLRGIGSRGLHIVTGPALRNRSFYRREGFDIEREREWGDSSLLFMGMRLESRS